MIPVWSKILNKMEWYWYLVYESGMGTNLNKIARLPLEYTAGAPLILASVCAPRLRALALSGSHRPASQYSDTCTTDNCTPFQQHATSITHLNPLCSVAPSTHQTPPSLQPSPAPRIPSPTRITVTGSPPPGSPPPDSPLPGSPAG